MIFALLLAAASNVPELPKDIPPNAQMYSVLMMGQPAGQMATWPLPNQFCGFFQFNDRGRGPVTRECVTRASVHVTGNDYMKDAVEENFTVSSGVAQWKNKAESGSKKISAPAFYASMYGAPFESALLVQAALKEGGKIALLPEGEAAVRKVSTLNGASLYAVSGFDFQPYYVWLDGRGDFYASADPWLSIIKKGDEAQLEALQKAQEAAKAERSAEQAKRLAHKPSGKLLIHDVNVFHSERAQLEKHRDVLIEGERIIFDRPTAPAAKDAQVIEGNGKTLLPGLWDMHAHVSDNDGLLNLSCGVTTVRDLANDVDTLLARKKRIEDGTEIGTRIVLAGIIDGKGPFQGPTKALASNLEEALQWVRTYSKLGYVQIKLYSSLKPELVAPVAEEAHRLGMRVSGHIPAYMLASQAVSQGYDEIQHLNFLMLNFMPDVQDTRSRSRFIEPAKRFAEMDLSSQPVRDFVQLLLDRHTALDPTLTVMEGTLTSRAGAVSPSYAAVASRLPVQVRRGLYSGDLPVPEGMDERYKASFQRGLQLIGMLWKAGVPIEAGTDNTAGFALHRELELDVQAGIPAPATLQLATLGAARIMGLDKELGSLRPGKYADAVLVEGDPSTNISDVRKVALTIKNGLIYDARELDLEMGVQP